MGYTDVAVTKAQLEFNAVTAGTKTNSKSLVTNSSGYMDKVTAVELQLNDTNNSDTLALWWNEDDTSDRTLAFKVNGGNATLDLTAGGTNAFNSKILGTLADAGTNAVAYGQRITHTTSGTAVAGFGTGIEFELEENDGTNRVAGSIDVLWTDAGEGSNADADMVFNIMFNDAGASEAMRIRSNKNLELSASLVVPATKKVFLDGGGHTSWSESASDVASLIVGGVEALTIKEATNIIVGIQNASPEAWHAVWTALQFGGNGALFAEMAQGTGKLINLSQNIYNDGVYKYINTDEASRYSQANGKHNFYVATSGTEDTDIAGNETLALTIGNDASSAFGGPVFIPEMTTPTPISAHISVYGKSDDLAYWQDGGGVEHNLTYSDYAGLGMDTSTGFTIDLVDLFHKFELFDHDMPERVSNGVFGSNHIVLGATADYKILINSSFSAAAASKEFVGRVYCIGAALGGEIAGITGATPGVVSTDSAHGLSNGNKVKLTSNAMVEAMDKLFIVANVTATTFELTDDEGVNVATGGYTGADTNGTVHLATETSAHWHRNSSGTAIGNVSGHDIFSATISETLEYYIKNKTDANNATFDTTHMSIERL